MIKDKAVEHEDQLAPNWANKSYEILTSAPALAIIFGGILLLAGLAFWNQRRPAYSDVSQSQPDSSLQLPVVSSGAASTPAATYYLDNQSSNQSVGPAPVDSASNLQSAGSTQNNVGGLTQALNQSVQSASAASQSTMQQLGL